MSNCKTCKFKVIIKNTILGQNKAFYCATDLDSQHLMKRNDRLTHQCIQNCQRYRKGVPQNIESEIIDRGEFLIFCGSLINQEDWDVFKKKGIKII